MAHRNRIRASQAAWTSGVVTAAEWEAIDVGQWKALGEWGGTYALEELLEIGGQPVLIHDLQAVELSVEELSTIDAIFGVNPGSDFTVNASAAFHAGVEFFGAVTTFATLTAEGDIVLGNSSADDLSVGATSFFVGQATFNNDVTFNDPVDVNDTLTADAIAVLGDLTVGDDLTVTDDVAVGGDLDVTGTTNLVGNVTMQNACTIGSSTADLLTVEAISEFVGNATFNNKVTCGSSDNDDLDVVATMILRTAMEFAGNGRVPFRPVALPGSSGTYTVTDGNVFWLNRELHGTTDLTFTMSDSGSQNGDWALFAVRAGASSSDITISFSGTSARFVGDGYNEYKMILAMRMSGSWRTLFTIGAA